MLRFAGHNMIGHGFPPEEGRRFGALLVPALSRRDPWWGKLVVDITNVLPGTIQGGFFFGALQEIYEHDSTLIFAARSVEWECKFPFQYRLVRGWVNQWKPVQSIARGGRGR